MGVKLTKKEIELVKAGELDPNKIDEHRQTNPITEDELEKVKQEIKETNLKYKEAIQKNKDLYEELKENRKKKEEYRIKITELRNKKKQLIEYSL